MRLTVLKRNDIRQEYDTEKIRSGIEKALEKRPLSEDKKEKLITDIEYAIHARESNEISSKDIGRIILEKLKEIDDVAYLRFASVYKSFGSAESFKKEMEKMKKI